MNILGKFINSYAVPILIIIGIIIVRANFYTHYAIPSESMYPSLEVNDIVLGKSVKKTEKPVFTGQIYVFKNDKTKDNMVKRLVAKPNDTIEYKNGLFYINGTKLFQKEVEIPEETMDKLFKRYEHRNFKMFQEKSTDGVIYNVIYSDFSMHSKEFVEKYLNREFSYTLKEDEYFFLGDNRNYSADSRYYGVVKRGEIKTNIERIIFNRNFLFDPEQRFFNQTI